MPAIKYYEVEQTRTVKVSAVSPAEAMLLANLEFAKAQPVEEPIPNNELRGHVTTAVEVTTLNVRKEL